jgi:hypothetical protein
MAEIGRLGGWARGQRRTDRPPPLVVSEGREEPERVGRCEDAETHVSDEIARDVRDEGDEDAGDAFW